MVSTSLATIAGELGALKLMSWVVVGYTLASTVLLPVLGKLGDVLGARRIFLGSLVVFLAASLACGFAQDMAWLIAARVLQGMSSAGLQLMSQTIIARVTTPRERPRYMAIIGAAFPIAILVGPVLGGAITDYWGWSWVFSINIPVGTVALGLALIAVPHLEPGPMPRHFDVAGAAVFTTALVALVLAVTWAAERSAGPATAAALAVSVLGFVAFFFIERRAPEPIVPLHFFANRTIAAGTALSAIIGVGLFSITAYLPTYFQMAYQTTATVSGFVPIATVFGMLFSNLLTGWLASRTGRYRIFPILGTSLGIGRTFGDGHAASRASAVGAHDRHGSSGNRYRRLHEPDRRCGPGRRPGQPDRHHHGNHQPGAAGRINRRDGDHRRGDRLRCGGPAAGRS